MNARCRPQLSSGSIGSARAAAALTLVLIARSAGAQVSLASGDPGTRASAERGPTELARLAHVEATLAADRQASLRWYALWAAAFVGSAGVRAGLWAGSSDRDLVAESRVVCVLSVLGILSTAPVAPAALFGDEPPPPDAPAAAWRAYLERRETRLTKAAELERFGRSPLAHFAGIVVGASAGLYLWKVDHLPGRGTFTALTSIAASEAKIWTQPTRALRTARLGAKSSWVIPVGISPLTGSATGTGLLFVGAF